MAKSKDQKIKEDLLGKVRKPQVGEYVPDRESVSGPLLQSGTVIRAGCTRCGYCLEILESAAERLAELAGVEKPEIWEGYYFEAHRCPICDTDYSEVSLKRIDDLP